MTISKVEKARTKRADRSLPSFFLLSGRAALIVTLLGFAALGGALYLRYRVIQNTPLGLACEAGLDSLICAVRVVVIEMFTQNGFGWTALIAATVQLWRPNLVAFVIGLVAALAGLVLYNANASALACAFLVLSLARPAPEGQPRQAG